MEIFANYMGSRQGLNLLKFNNNIELIFEGTM